jgi:hypothetical protein
VLILNLFARSAVLSLGQPPNNCQPVCAVKFEPRMSPSIEARVDKATAPASCMRPTSMLHLQGPQVQNVFVVHLHAVCFLEDQFYQLNLSSYFLQSGMHMHDGAEIWTPRDRPAHMGGILTPFSTGLDMHMQKNPRYVSEDHPTMNFYEPPPSPHDIFQGLSPHHADGVGLKVTRAFVCALNTHGVKVGMLL